MFQLELVPVWIETRGDIDQKTSLRTLGKTDFFTREIDQLLLDGLVRLAVHSAKDLPSPIPEGLCVAALTPSIDSRDALVLREGESIVTLPPNARIATSSERREEAARRLRSDFCFTDLRGTIGKRLRKLEKGEVEGVIIAEAALIRLGLTHLNRVYLPGETAEGQGRLAIVCRSSDVEMVNLFRCALCI